MLSGSRRPRRFRLPDRLRFLNAAIRAVLRMICAWMHSEAGLRMRRQEDASFQAAIASRKSQVRI